VPLGEAIQRLKKTRDSLPTFPYFVPDILRYEIPDTNPAIPAGVIQIHLKQIVGLQGRDKFVAKIALQVPEAQFATAAMGPPYAYDFKWASPPKDFSSDKGVKAIMQGLCQVALFPVSMFGKEGEEPTAFGTFSLRKLVTRRTVELTVPLEGPPAAAALIELTTQRAFKAIEVKAIERPLTLLPSFVFPVKGAGAGRQTGAAVGPSLVAPPPKPPPAPAPKAHLPFFYIPTAEELGMFWAIEVLKHWVLTLGIVIDRVAQSKGELELPPGIKEARTAVQAKKTKLEEDIGEERMSEEAFVAELRKSIEREKGRLSSFPAELTKYRANLISMTESELAGFEE
jgi:hypothetical protein